MNSLSRKNEPLSVESLGGEAREGFKTDQLGQRLARYGKAKSNALQFRRYLLDQDENKLADQLGSCGNYAVFHDYYTIRQTRLAKMCTCKKHLICPLCAIRRGAKALRVYLARIEQLIKQNPKLKPYLVTLTVRNGPELNERMAHLMSCLRAYHKRRKGARQNGEVRKAKAAVWSYEVTNRGKCWHPHVHAIWLAETAPDAFRLSEEWHQLTSDSMIVDVSPIIGDPVDACMEVFKYALKFSDLNNTDRLHAYKVLKGKRLQDAFGELRGLDVEPVDGDQLLDDLPYIERIYYWMGSGYVEQPDSGEIYNHQEAA